MAEHSLQDEWLHQARRGDARALFKLLAYHHPRLWARADAGMDRGMKARLSADDILQEAYFEVFRHLDRFEDRGSAAFLNWVLTILDNKLIDARRALHRKVRDVAREVSPGVRGASASVANLLDQLYADSLTPSRVVRREEALGAVLACMSSLSDVHRQVLQLRFLDGHPVAEVARRLDKSEASVVALTRKALDALRAAMDRMGDFTRGG